MKGNAIVVLLSAPGDSSERSEQGLVCRFDELVERNPEAFLPGDDARLLRGVILRRLGLLIQKTSDETCILCGTPVGKGAHRCHACEHRDEGPGYRAGASRTPLDSEDAG